MSLSSQSKLIFFYLINYNLGKHTQYKHTLFITTKCLKHSNFLSNEHHHDYAKFNSRKVNKLSKTVLILCLMLFNLSLKVDC